MMKIWNITWKEIVNRFTSPSEWLFYLVLPILFIFLLGGGFERLSQSQEVPQLVVVDEDGSTLSLELVGFLESADNILVTKNSFEEAQAAFKQQDIDAYLVIPSGFEDTLIIGEVVDVGLFVQEDSQVALAAEQEAINAMDTLSRAIQAAHVSTQERATLAAFSSSDARSEYFKKSLIAAQDAFFELPERVELTVPEQAQESEILADMNAAHVNTGQLITWVFIPLIATSVSFAYERTNGTLRRLLTTPSSKSTFILGTISGQLLPALVQIALLLGFGIMVMDVNWGNDIGALLVLILAFSLASVALGSMIGTFIKTPQQANSLSVMVGMALALIGGCWFPNEMFPEVVFKFSRIFPTTWAMQGLTDISMRGYGLMEILPEAGVLFGFAFIFFLISVWRFRFE